MRDLRQSVFQSTAPPAAEVTLVFWVVIGRPITPSGLPRRIEDRMRMRKAGWAAAVFVYALLTASAWIADASAEPQKFNCVLTDKETQPGSENRPIVVVFDEDAKTLIAKDGDHSYSFSKISISNVSLNGMDDSISFGIDRSSLGIVWQQYGADKVTTEFGHCHHRK